MTPKECEAFKALRQAAQGAVNHLIACEAGRIIAPFVSRSLPKLIVALEMAAELDRQPPYPGATKCPTCDGYVSDHTFRECGHGVGVGPCPACEQRRGTDGLPLVRG